VFEQVLQLCKCRSDFLPQLLALFVVCGVCFTRTADMKAANHTVQQALIITIPLIDGRPDSQEVKNVYKLEDELIKAIERSRAGEYDGNEVGVRTFTMYAYGPSADKLFEVARAVLAKYPLPAGSRAVKRYGQPGAKEERIPLDNPAPSRTAN
jgi:hypothetical protein